MIHRFQKEMILLISSYCDLDSRRHLGLLPQRLDLKPYEILLRRIPRLSTTVSWTHVSPNDYDEEKCTRTYVAFSNGYEIRFQMIEYYFHSMYCREYLCSVSHHNIILYKYLFFPFKEKKEMDPFSISHNEE